MDRHTGHEAHILHVCAVSQLEHFPIKTVSDVIETFFEAISWYK